MWSGREVASGALGVLGPLSARYWTYCVLSHNAYPFVVLTGKNDITPLYTIVNPYFYFFSRHAK